MAIVVVLAVVDAIRLAPEVADLQRGGTVLKDAATSLGTSPADWTPERVARARLLARESVRVIHSPAARLTADPMLSAAARIPLLGDNVRATRDLALAADAGANSMVDLVDVADAYVSRRSDTSAPGTRLLAILKASEAPLRDADARLRGPVASLRADASLTLLPPIRRRLESGIAVLKPGADQVAVGALAARYAPEALGAGGSATYLVLFANPAELRPAGGLVSDAGVITFDQGAPVRVDIRPDAEFDPYPRQTFPVPYPIDQYLHLNHPSASLNEANWDPDFPSSARFSEQIFTAATGETVQGTISLDPYTVAALLDVIGPVTVPLYGTFDSSNFFTRLDEIVNVPATPGFGKKAVPPIATAVIRQALEQPSERWPKMIAALATSAAQRHLQLYLHQPDLAAAAARSNFDGRLLGGTDYLMVVDGNIGATKGDYFMTKSLDLKVEAGPKAVRHRMVATYDLPPPRNQVDQVLNPGAGTYHDYLRVYLPPNAQVDTVTSTIDGKTQPQKVDQVGFDHELEYVATYIEVPRGHPVSLTIDYDTPPQAHYTLLVQKQAGQLTRHLNLQVSSGGPVRSASSDLRTDFYWRP